MLQSVKDDCYRYSKSSRIYLKIFLKDAGYRFMICWRMLKDFKNPFLRVGAKIILHQTAKINGIEIPLSVKLGGGYKNTSSIQHHY